jgi:RHS repeat-associated protein
MILTKSYFYDGNLLLAEKVGSQITKIYINDGQGIVGMVRPIYDGSNNLSHYQRLYYLYDSLGSVSAVTGENGLPLQNYFYSPFGICLNVTGDPINNLQFVGRYGGYLDNDTGLTYFWHRWYDSKDGRWISRDPINVLGGNNLYQYVGNNAVNKEDFMGLKDCKNDPPCSGAPPLSSDCSQCNNYGNETYLLVSLKCFCKCAGDSPWSQKVRGCLSCEHGRGTNPMVAHLSCYAAGGLDAPYGALAKCYIQCNVLNPFTQK